MKTMKIISLWESDINISRIDDIDESEIGTEIISENKYKHIDDEEQEYIFK